MRYFLEVAYDGTRFHGWQVQPNALSVQEVLDDCLSKVLRQPISSIGSGRTDTGVHAGQQYVHFDVTGELDTQQVVYRLNRILPADIAAKGLHAVPDEAHARFDAFARTYHYHISLVKSPFKRYYAYYHSRSLDVEQMNRAAVVLLQYEDFTTFSKVKGDTKHYRCNIYEAVWRQEGEELVFTIRANRFLRGMVRLVVGTLLDVGRGKISVEAFEQVVASQDRSRSSGAAPAEGLYLAKVEYPEHVLPQRG
ncbi:tRNA pseudouridine38-40 synthase [Pontibacter ummariensis]|uniref:tRNA pseudouridine synthase A n=1 Tax=Pontibacter ummariensis TaxID=1610492 RepID=A0A239GT55_9BACT|nr:tRNA pseudouridine(38-40) synthase TruA [Pontibacter ummariensis]PRY11036.1 tRNA pseudouridine38-40 synthase [Pontibacter ummariensis]SNS72307.1 tRNA pseudouridine38-40 synthase [Pontibacter ummariensis]